MSTESCGGCPHWPVLGASGLQQTLLAELEGQKAQGVPPPPPPSAHLLCLGCHARSNKVDDHISAHAQQPSAGHEVVLDLQSWEMYCTSCGDNIYAPDWDAVVAAARVAANSPAASRRAAAAAQHCQQQGQAPGSAGCPHAALADLRLCGSSKQAEGGSSSSKQQESEALRSLLASGAVRRVPSNGFPPGLRGLNNLGNTCFMNSVLQALLHAPLLPSHYLADRHPRGSCAITADGGICLNCEMDAVVSAAFSGDSAALSPAPFLHAWWLLAGSHLGGYKQQDAHEFLLFVLTMLASTSGNDIVQALFGGSLRSDVTCCACGHTSTRHEHFSHISLDIPTPTAFQPPALNAGGGGRAAAGSGGRGSPSKGGRGSNAGSGRAAAAAVTEGSTGSAEAMANGTTATAAAASWGAGQGGCSRPLADLTKASEGSLRTGVGLEPHTRHQQQQQQEEEEEEEEEEQRRANLSLGQAAAGATGQWADWAPAAACTGSLGTAPGTFEAASGVRGPGGGALVIDDSEDAAQDTLSSPRARTLSAAGQQHQQPGAASSPGAAAAASGLPPIHPGHRGSGSGGQQQQHGVPAERGGSGRGKVQGQHQGVRAGQQQQASGGGASSGLPTFQPRLAPSETVVDAVAAASNLPGAQGLGPMPGSGTTPIAAAVARHPPLAGFYRLPGPSLVGCLQRFTREERLGGKEQWVCGACATAQAGVKQLSLRRLPPLLVLHAKRFEHTGGYRTAAKKLDTFLSFPLADLNMRPYLTSTLMRRHRGLHLHPGPAPGPGLAHELGCGQGVSNGPVPPPQQQQPSPGHGQQHRSQRQPRVSPGGGSASPAMPANGSSDALAVPGGAPPGPVDYLYDLFAVVCHKGNFQGGHYVAYVRCWDGRWYLCDDAWVVAVTEEHVRNCQAYMLFYAQKPLLAAHGGSSGGIAPG